MTEVSAHRDNRSAIQIGRISRQLFYGRSCVLKPIRNPYDQSKNLRRKLFLWGGPVHWDRGACQHVGTNCNDNSPLDDGVMLTVQHSNLARQRECQSSSL